MLTQEQYEKRLDTLVEKLNECNSRFKPLTSKMDKLTVGLEKDKSQGGRDGSLLYFAIGLVLPSQIEVCKGVYYFVRMAALDIRAFANNLRVKEVERDPKTDLYFIGDYFSKQ